MIPTKYCFLILEEDTRFIFFLYFSFLFYVFMSIFVIYKVFLLPYFNVFFLFFFYNFFNFFMFWDVPECSMFLVLSTPSNYYKYRGDNLQHSVVNNNGTQWRNSRAVTLSTHARLRFNSSMSLLLGAVDLVYLHNDTKNGSSRP